MLHFPELLDVRAGLAVVDVNDQDRFVSYLVFYAETFDIDDSNTREVCLPTNFLSFPSFSTSPQGDVQSASSLFWVRYSVGVME